MILGTIMEVHQLKGVAALALEQLQVCQNWNSTTDIYNSDLPAQSLQYPLHVVSLSFQADRTGRLSTSSKGQERSNQVFEPQPRVEQL